MNNLSNRGWVRRNRRGFLRVAGGLGAYLTTLSTLSPALLSQARDYGPPAWIPLAELEERLQQLGRQHPNLMTLAAVGKSVDGRSLWVATLTDPSAGDESKEASLSDQEVSELMGAEPEPKALPQVPTSYVAEPTED